MEIPALRSVKLAPRGFSVACLKALIIGALSVSPSLVTAASNAFERTETREPCSDHVAERQALWGDLHIHTRYSLDARTQDTRTSPDDAYAFAQGQTIPLQPYGADGKALRSISIDRPLDFAMVSDHAELLGDVAMCTTPEIEGYDSWQCGVFRRYPKVAFYLFNSTASMFGARLGHCGENGEACREASLFPWADLQKAAETAYDRSSDCEFTAFVGYEWTGTGTRAANLHRNVIFRNAEVPRLPTSFLDGDYAEHLWTSLETQCLDAGTGCDAIAIPHNSNISAGEIFFDEGNDGKPIDKKLAAQRARIERLVEVMQHKGSSECYFLQGTTADELCAFEQLPYDTFGGSYMTFMRKDIDPRGGFLREVLRDGLIYEKKLGINPYKFGFIGSTDTHIAASGGVSEKDFAGHGGAGVSARDGVPKGLPDKPEYNPGGLAAVWAEENSRDAIFAAMKRRETFGSSGPRIPVRFFAGDYDADMCQESEFAKEGYENGVPMGADLNESELQGKTPSFAVSAMADPQSVGLQRVQIIKGWVDATGQRQERVHDVAGDAKNGASVSLDTCETKGAGFSNLCTVWRDPEFNKNEPSWYYVRAVENPTCRWSQRICAANNVRCDDPSTIGEGLEACCDAGHRPVIQERAWSSPIWYNPESS